MTGEETVATSVIIVVVVLGLVQLSLFLWALIDLIKRPQTSLLPRWAWVLVIIFFEFVGPILYLVAGRSPTTVIQAPPASPAVQETLPGAAGSPETPGAAEPSARPAQAPDQRTEHAIDMLYGSKPGE